MKVLFLAPQPFYQERGTPIAVRQLLQVLSERGDQVDVLTYHEGADVDYAGITLYRTTHARFIQNIRPGFSWKKVLTNAFLLIMAFRFVLRNRYDIVHAVEEAAFIALALKLCFKIPYVYDMDSSLSAQIIEARPIFKPLGGLLRRAERAAIQQAKAVVPVCNALVQTISPYHPAKVMLLPDISLLGAVDGPVEDLRAAYGIRGPLLMYVGNLEHYQGIDLLLESFALAHRRRAATLVVIGGAPADIARYRRQCVERGIAERVYFIGSRPVKHLAAYLAQADILVSPRIKGNNTPMKIYSYLDSGKAVLATDLPTHRQVLSDDVALLAAPRPEPFAEQMCRLIGDDQLRERLGVAGKELIRRDHTAGVFAERVMQLYDWLSFQADDTRPGADSSMTTAIP